MGAGEFFFFFDKHAIIKKQRLTNEAIPLFRSKQLVRYIYLAYFDKKKISKLITLSQLTPPHTHNITHHPSNPSPTLRISWTKRESEAERKWLSTTIVAVHHQRLPSTTNICRPPPPSSSTTTTDHQIHCYMCS